MLANTDEENKKVEAPSKFEEASSVTGCGGTNTKPVLTPIEHITDAPCEADENEVDEDTHPDEPLDETD